MIGEMSTTKPAPNRRSAASKISLVAVAVLLCAIGYFGFRWIRTSMMLAYVDSAIGRMRVLSAAEAQFAKEHPEHGYTCNLSELPQSVEIERLITGNGVHNGYAFEVFGCQAPNIGRPNAAYYSIARPLHPGQPAFCSDQSGILKADYDGSIANCRTNGLPL